MGLLLHCLPVSVEITSTHGIMLSVLRHFSGPLKDTVYKAILNYFVIFLMSRVSADKEELR